MHEIGALTKAIDLVERIAKENQVEKIKSVTIEVGELTGFLPVFFEKYFPVVIEGRSVFERTELKIHIVKGQALCNQCENLYNVMKQEGKCPVCGSREKTVLGGQEFTVKHIEV